MENLILRDPLLQVVTLAKTELPQRLVWQAMHQDYCERFICEEPRFNERLNAPVAWSDGRVTDQFESEAGDICVKRLLKGGRGHFGPLEHPQITLACGWFPHSVMQQARTHRVGVSFDVQSMRYTGARIRTFAQNCGRSWLQRGAVSFISEQEEAELRRLFFVRPVGEYVDRQGTRYTYSKSAQIGDLVRFKTAAIDYADKLNSGFAEEHARGILPFEFRQHFVVSFNLRSALHFMDLRSKLDAQDEIRALCDLIWAQLTPWAPEICSWYETSRLGKARLSP